MLYPSDFEAKIGFDHIRFLLQQHCLSNLGKEWIDNHLAFSSDYNTIITSLQEFNDFQRFEQEEPNAYEPNFFDVREAILHARPERTYITENHLFDLQRSLQTVEQLTRAFRQNNTNETESKKGELRYPHLYELSNQQGTFSDIIYQIDTILDKYGRVKDSASSKLATIRREKQRTARSISGTLRMILAEAQHDGLISSDALPTMREGRLVIPVAPALKRKVSGIVHDESTSGKTVFIEPTAVVEANNRIRELENEEKREVIYILQELTASIRPQIPEILTAFNFLGRIDFLRACNIFSSSIGAHVPNSEDAPILQMLQAVHPLLEFSLQKQGRSMSKLDIHLENKHKQLIISGPNAGGKSICLKTVGLLQYMFQCGLPIPIGENSILGIFESLFIDIGDEQSIEDDLSTYSSHLLNMKNMMAKSSSRSLLLIDEFGGGTEPLIGGALAEAILIQFIEKDCTAIITTHYQNLKRLAEQHLSVVNGAMLYDRGEMRPLFRLQIGSPGSSFAVDIARKIGLPNKVIQYASEIVGKDYILSDKYLQDIVRDRMYWERKRKDIHKQQKLLESRLSAYGAKIRALSAERKEILRQAKEEVETILKRSNAQIEKTIREIRERQAEKQQTLKVRQELENFKEDTILSLTSDDERIARKMAKLLRYQRRKKEGKTEHLQSQKTEINPPITSLAKTSDQLKKISVGDTVCIKGQNSIGKVEELIGKQARVLFGMMYANIDIARLQHTSSPKEENKFKQASTFVSKETQEAFYKKKLEFKPELDIRGMRAEEAQTALAYYIDDAISLAFPQVRILHGTGTGTLRAVVRTYLSGLRNIKNYHDEHVQFGGAGITVVEI